MSRQALDVESLSSSVNNGIPVPGSSSQVLVIWFKSSLWKIAKLGVFFPSARSLVSICSTSTVSSSAMHPNCLRKYHLLDREVVVQCCAHICKTHSQSFNIDSLSTFSYYIRSYRLCCISSLAHQFQLNPRSIPHFTRAVVQGSSMSNRFITY